MAKTIKQQAEMILSNNGWTYDTKRRSPGWTHTKTPDVVFLGDRGSIRRGTSRTTSRPIGGTGSLEALTAFVQRIGRLPEPPPTEPSVKQANPLTELRRRAHALVQSLDYDSLYSLVDGFDDTTTTGKAITDNLLSAPTEPADINSGTMDMEAYYRQVREGTVNLST